MKNGLSLFSLLFLLSFASIFPIQAAVGGQSDLRAGAILQSWLERELAQNESSRDLTTTLLRFYESRHYQPTWVGGGGLTLQGNTLLKTLNRSRALAQEDLIVYIDHLEMVLMDAMQAIPLEQTFVQPLLEAEVAMTQIALYFATHDNSEIVNLAGVTASRQSETEHQIAGMLAQALAGPDWDALLKATYPRQKPYLALKESLERYKTIQLLGGWPVIPEGPKLRQGRKDSRISLLRKRLVISGDMGLDKLSIDPEFDEALAKGVSRFQQRHGLKVDGVVGAKTLAAINISVQDRIDQIKLNMARWYGLPDRLGPRHLLVNIPGFKLDVVENHRVVRSMRAIVGKKERRTPVMSARMTYLEINPYWNIPQKIACKDILPKIHNDPQFLVRQRIQVFGSWKKSAPVLDPLAIDWKRYSKTYFPFRLRQEPAATNALGQIKFIFPNRFSVYIHDTPAKSLFNKANRSFSSGCVRVEKPMDLAAYLLAGQRWNPKKIKARVQSGKRKVVVLKESIAVHLVYLTAWADDDGAVHFYEDLYNRNEHLSAQLKLANPKMPDFSTHMMVADTDIEQKQATTTAQQLNKMAGTGTT